MARGLCGGPVRGGGRVGRGARRRRHDKRQRARRQRADERRTRTRYGPVSQRCKGRRHDLRHRHRRRCSGRTETACRGFRRTPSRASIRTALGARACRNRAGRSRSCRDRPVRRVSRRPVEAPGGKQRRCGSGPAAIAAVAGIARRCRPGRRPAVRDERRGRLRAVLHDAAIAAARGDRGRGNGGRIHHTVERGLVCRDGDAVVPVDDTGYRHF